MQVFRNWQILVMENMFQEIFSPYVHTFGRGTVYNFQRRFPVIPFFLSPIHLFFLMKTWILPWKTYCLNTYTHRKHFLCASLFPNLFWLSIFGTVFQQQHKRTERKICLGEFEGLCNYLIMKNIICQKEQQHVIGLVCYSCRGPDVEKCACLSM